MKVIIIKVVFSIVIGYLTFDTLRFYFNNRKKK